MNVKEKIHWKHESAHTRGCSEIQPDATTPQTNKKNAYAAVSAETLQRMCSLNLFHPYIQIIRGEGRRKLSQRRKEGKIQIGEKGGEEEQTASSSINWKFSFEHTYIHQEEINGAIYLRHRAIQSYMLPGLLFECNLHRYDGHIIR